MTRINLFRNVPSTLNSVAWGKPNFAKPNFAENPLNPTTSTLIFAALLITCSLTVGCSSDQPKPKSSVNQSSIAQPTPPITTSSMPAATPVQQAAAKPVRKKVVHKAKPFEMLKGARMHDRRPGLVGGGGQSIDDPD